MFEPAKSPTKKPRRSMPATPTPKKTVSSYSFVVHSLAAENLPYICIPFNPWIQAEVGSTIHRTTRQHYVANFVRFSEEMNFEVHGSDLENGIEMDVRIFAKRPFRRRQELGRARVQIKLSFPNLEERTSIECPFYQLSPSDEVFHAGKLLVDATLRQSLQSKASFFDFKVIHSPKKAYILPPKPSQLKDEPVDLKKRVILSLKKVTTPDITVATEADDAKQTPYSFSLEAKFGADTIKSAFISGKLRNRTNNRNKDIVGNLCFENPDVDFEMSREAMQFEELHLLIYAKQADQGSARAIGRAIFPLSIIGNKPDDESTVEMCSPIKDVSGSVTGKMFIYVQLAPSGRNRRLAAVEALKISEHTCLPDDLEYGWVKINNVEGVSLNSLKLLGRSVRYAHLNGTPMFSALTAQDLLLVMEYGQKWTSHSPVLTDLEDACTWDELDFRFLVSREDFLHDSVRISVFNRKLKGKEGLLGSAVLALQQFVMDPSLSIAHIPVKLRSAKNKVNGTLYINGIVVKDGGGEWIPGTVETVHNDGSYDIRYDDGELEKCIGKDFLRAIPPGEAAAIKAVDAVKTPKKVHRYSVGAKVEVRLGHQDIWLPATVDAVRSDGSYDVSSTFDLPSKNVDEADIRLAGSKPRSSNSLMRQGSSKGVRFLYGPGDKVEGNFNAKGKWYKAKVWKSYVQNDRPVYDLDYASGVREVAVGDDRIRLYDEVVVASSSFMVTPQKSIFDIEPEEEPLTILEEDEEEEDVQVLTNVDDLNFDNLDFSVVPSQHSPKAHYQKSTRSSRAMSHRSLSLSSNSLHSLQDSPNNSSPSLSRHRLSGGSMHSFSSKRSLRRLSSDRSLFSVSTTPGKTTTMRLQEKASLLVGDSVEVSLRPNGYHYVPAQVLEAEPLANTYKLRLLDTEEVVENIPREQIRLSLEDLEDMDRQYPFAVGDKIQADFRGTGEWVSGVIKKDRGYGIYDIDYVDGRLETKVNADSIRAIQICGEVELKYREGDKVEVRSEDLGYWYTAVIHKARNDRTYDIVYSDGQKDIYVPERFIRPGRNDSGNIPSIKPAFIAGDRVYVKSSSKAFGVEIRLFSESIRKSDEEMKALFVLLRSVEEEDAHLEVKRSVAFKETAVLLELLDHIMDYEKLNPDVTKDDQELLTSRKQLATMCEKLKADRDVIAGDLPLIANLVKEVRAEEVKISSLVRQRLSKHFNFLNHRTGMEDEEMHALTVAIGTLKIELEAIENAKDKAKKCVSAQGTCRHVCYEHTQAVLKVQKIGQDLFNRFATAVASHPGPTARKPQTKSHKLHRTRNANTLLGRFDSNRSLLDDAIPLVDFSDIYFGEAEEQVYNHNAQRTSTDTTDYFCDLPRIDTMLINISSDEEDNDEEEEESQHDAPQVDPRRTTGMGAVLLAFKDLRSGSTDLGSDNGISPRRGGANKKAWFANVPNLPTDTATRDNLTPRRVSNSHKSKPLTPLHEDAGSFNRDDASPAQSNMISTPFPAEREGSLTLKYSYNPSNGKELIQTMPHLPAPSVPVEDKAEHRWKEAKKLVDEKRIRALVAEQAFQKAKEHLDLIEKQYHIIETDCKNIFQIDEVKLVNDSKLGEENRFIDKQLEHFLDLVKRPREENRVSYNAAQGYLSSANQFYISGVDFSKPLEERLHMFENCKQAYAHHWGCLEEAKGPLEQENALLNDILHLFKQKRDALRHIHRLSKIFALYKEERKELLEKERDVISIYQDILASKKELATWKEKVDDEAATWEWYNRKLSVASKRPARRSTLMNISSSNLSPHPTEQSSDSFDRPVRRASSAGILNRGGGSSTSPAAFSPNRHSMQVVSPSTVSDHLSLPSPLDGDTMPVIVNPLAKRPSAQPTPLVDDDSNSSLGGRKPSFNNLTINTSLERPSSRIQAERKSILALQEKLALGSAYYEITRMRSLEEGKIADNLDDYDKAVTNLIEDDYKVVKFEKRLYGSAFYYSTLSISGPSSAGQSQYNMNPMSQFSSSTYNLLSNLNKVLSGSTSNHDIYRAKTNNASPDNNESYHNDNIKLLFLNQDKLNFMVIQDTENLLYLKDQIERCVEIRSKLLQTLEITKESIHSAIECYQSEYQILVASIANLVTDHDSLEMVKKIVNAHRLHHDNQAKVRTLLRDLLMNNQEIVELEQSNRVKEEAIAASRKVCEEMIESITQMGNGQARISQNTAIQNINGILLQCEELKVLIGNYQKHASQCDDSLSGLDEKLRNLAISRLQKDFCTNWEDEYESSNGVNMSNSCHNMSSVLVSNTAANAGLPNNGASSNNLNAQVSGGAGLVHNASNPNLLSGGNAAQMNALNSNSYDKYCEVNKLYEEEIDLLSKGILFTKQRLDFLSLINRSLSDEQLLLHQIHVQKEYLLFHIAYNHGKEVEDQCLALIDSLQTSVHDLNQNYTNNESEWNSLNQRVEKLKVLMKTRYKYLLNKQTINDYNEWQNLVDTDFDEVQKGLQALKHALEEEKPFDVTSEQSSYNRTKERHHNDVLAALRAYEEFESDAVPSGLSQQQLIATTSQGTAPAAGSGAPNTLQRSAGSFSLKNASTRVDSYEKDYLYTVASLVHGTKEAEQQLKELQEILDGLKLKETALNPLLDTHRAIQGLFNHLYHLIDEWNHFIDGERTKKQYHTLLGRSVVGNFPSTNKARQEKEEEARHRHEEVWARLGGYEGIQSLLDSRSVVVGGDVEEFHLNAPVAMGYQVVAISSEGLLDSRDVLTIESNTNLKEYIHLARDVSSNSPHCIMKYRGNLKTLPRPGSLRTMTRTKTVKDLNAMSGASSNKLVPALVANIERKTTSKNFLANLLGEQTLWKALNVKEPPASKIDPALLLSTTFASDIKYFEEYLSQSNARLRELEVRSEELNRILQAHQKLRRQLSPDQERKDKEELQALREKVLLSEDEISDMLAVFDRLSAGLHEDQAKE
eukprot:scaffold471_cov318-Ochromonas_danica.AAC.31